MARLSEVSPPLPQLLVASLTCMLTAMSGHRSATPMWRATRRTLTFDKGRSGLPIITSLTRSARMSIKDPSLLLWMQRWGTVAGKGRQGEGDEVGKEGEEVGREGEVVI